MWAKHPSCAATIHQLRSLDDDLHACCRAAAPFDWQRVPFVLEAAGCWLVVLCFPGKLKTFGCFVTNVQTLLCVPLWPGGFGKIKGEFPHSVAAPIQERLACLPTRSLQCFQISVGCRPSSLWSPTAQDMLGRLWPLIFLMIFLSCF